MYDSYSLLSHCHSTAVALEDFWPAVGSPSFISISLSASLCLLLHSIFCFHFTLSHPGESVHTYVLLHRQKLYKNTH